MKAEEHEVFRFVLVNTSHIYWEWDLAVHGGHARTMSAPLLFWYIALVHNAYLMYCLDYFQVLIQFIIEHGSTDCDIL